MMDRDDALDYRVLYAKAVVEIERLRACIKLGEGVNWDDEIISLRLDNQRLRARAAEVVAAWQREDDSVGEAIEVLGRFLQPKEIA